MQAPTDAGDFSSLCILTSGRTHRKPLRCVTPFGVIFVAEVARLPSRPKRKSGDFRYTNARSSRRSGNRPEAPKCLTAATLRLTPAARGRVVAEAIASDIDSPPYAKSIMDGYAVRSADTASPTSLTVVEEVPAGRMPTRSVGPGQAARVMTGAPIPDGADAVIPHEETEVSGDTVRIRGPVAAGKFILPRGREMRAGEVVVPAGTVLTPAAFGLLASVGRTDVRAFPAPRLAIISTGDELVEPPTAAGTGPDSQQQRPDAGRSRGASRDRCALPRDRSGRQGRARQTGPRRARPVRRV